MRTIRTAYTAVIFALAALILTGCGLSGAQAADEPSAVAKGDACPVTEPVLLTPPQDDAVLSEPAEGYYYVNEDQSIIASAWWWGQGTENHWQAGENGNKVGWFRPEAARLEITGKRLDGQAEPMQAEVPCCYPTRFQATGLYFPTGGCWEVTAKAGEKLLTFVAWVEE